MAWNETVLFHYMWNVVLMKISEGSQEKLIAIWAQAKRSQERNNFTAVKEKIESLRME